jgi:hypothetical protein
MKKSFGYGAVLMAIVSMLVLALIQTGNGQDIRIQLDEIRAPNLRGAIVFDQQADVIVANENSAAEYARKNYINELQVRLDELVFACELSEPQQKKLAVGIKGIAEKLTAKEPQAAAAANNRININAARNVVVEFAGEAGVAIVRERRINVLNSPRMTFLWNDLASKVLTEAQKEKLRLVRVSRAKHVRNTNVAVVVMAVDSELLLKPQQRQKLTKLLDLYVGGIFEKATLFDTKVAPTANFIRKIPDQTLEKLLTKSQLTAMKKRWSSPPQNRVRGGEFQEVIRGLPQLNDIQVDDR